LRGALFAYLKGSVFRIASAYRWSVDALVMVLLAAWRPFPCAIVGAIVYKGAHIWLVSRPICQNWCWAFHRPDRGRISQRHRRDAGDDQKSPAVLIAKSALFHLHASRPPNSMAPTLLSVVNLSKSMDHGLNGVSVTLSWCVPRLIE